MSSQGHLGPDEKFACLLHGARTRPWSTTQRCEETSKRDGGRLPAGRWPAFSRGLSLAPDFESSCTMMRPGGEQTRKNAASVLLYSNPADVMTGSCAFTSSRLRASFALLNLHQHFLKTVGPWCIYSQGVPSNQRSLTKKNIILKIQTK